MRRISKAFMPAAFVLLAALVHFNCHHGLLYAPEGSRIVRTVANPDRIPADGGSSIITTFVVRGTGIPVENGTNVRFFTNIGRLDPDVGKTVDGFASVTLISEGRQGTALVRAILVGPAIGTITPTPAPAATPSTGGTSTPVPTGTSGPTSTPLPTGSTGGDCGGSTDCATVFIGAAGNFTILVTSNPANLNAVTPVVITARVFDVDGNPAANVPVLFSIDNTTHGTGEEQLASNGQPVLTDANGIARDFLTTAATLNAPKSKIQINVDPIGGQGHGAVVVCINGCGD